MQTVPLDNATVKFGKNYLFIHIALTNNTSKASLNRLQPTLEIWDTASQWPRTIPLPRTHVLTRCHCSHRCLQSHQSRFVCGGPSHGWRSCREEGSEYCYCHGEKSWVDSTSIQPTQYLTHRQAKSRLGGPRAKYPSMKPMNTPKKMASCTWKHRPKTQT